MHCTLLTSPVCNAVILSDQGVNSKRSVEAPSLSHGTSGKALVSSHIIRKKPMRYPIEDLDVIVTERDRKNGLLSVKWPTPKVDATNVPFNDNPGVFTSFLETWNFLHCFG